MAYMIRELRNSSGMTQREFAEAYGIPMSTLRKWEQGESSPAPYVIALIAGTLPSIDAAKKVIKTKNNVFYYDKAQNKVYDKKGTGIKVSSNLEEVKEQNLGIYVEDLFDSYYQIVDKFERDCRLDIEEDILWSR